MTAVDEVKQALADAARDMGDVPSVCYDFDAYARRWPFVVMVTDWDVWNDSKRALRLEVIRWLERHEDPYDFRQFRDGCDLVGFKDLKAATRFKLRWSGQGRMMSAPAQHWSPHPLSSTFEASCTDESLSVTDASSRRSERPNGARYRGNKPHRGSGMKA
jgi:hypothetical protein